MGSTLVARIAGTRLDATATTKTATTAVVHVAGSRGPIPYRNDARMGELAKATIPPRTPRPPRKRGPYWLRSPARGSTAIAMNRGVLPPVAPSSSPQFPCFPRCPPCFPLCATGRPRRSLATRVPRSRASTRPKPSAKKSSPGFRPGPSQRPSCASCHRRDSAGSMA